MKPSPRFTTLAALLIATFSASAASADSQQQPRAAGIETYGYTWNSPDQDMNRALAHRADPDKGEAAYKVCKGCHKADGAGLLTGAILVDTAARLFLLISRRGLPIVEKRVDLAALEAYLTLTVKRIEREIGRTVDGQMLPQLIERLAGAALDSPARLRPKPETLIEEQLPPILADLARLAGRS